MELANLCIIITYSSCLQVESFSQHYTFKIWGATYMHTYVHRKVEIYIVHVHVCKYGYSPDILTNLPSIYTCISKALTIPHVLPTSAG